MSVRSSYLRGAAAAFLAAIALLTFGISPSQSRAAESPESVEAAHEAFEQGRFPWYDAERDTLKPLTLRPPAAPRKPFEFGGGFLRYLAWTALGAALRGAGDLNRVYDPAPHP